MNKKIDNELLDKLYDAILLLESKTNVKNSSTIFAQSTN